MKEKILCMLLSAGMMLLPSVALPVQASSVAYSPEASLEIMELLYTLLINGMMASGAADIRNLDYDSSMDLFRAFMDSLCQSSGLPGTDIQLDGNAVYMALDDGTVLTWADLAQSYTDGTGALQLPDEETWNNFRVINGGGGDPGKKDPFSKVEAIKIGTSFMAAISAWIGKLLEGDIADLNPDIYFSGETDYYYDGYQINEDGLYEIRGHFEFDNISSSRYMVYDMSSNTTFPLVGIRGTIGVTTSFTADCIRIYRLNSNNKLEAYSVGERSYMFNYSGNLLNQGFSMSTLFYYSDACAANIPIFDSEEAALAFLQDGNLSGLLNGEAYDFPALAAALAVQFAPFAGIYIDPAALPDLALALDTALAPLPAPLPGVDPAVNTDTYKQAVTDAVTSTVPDVLPDPVPEPAPNPDPSPDDADLGDYKVDLRMVFPFCLPFDFIHFLEVMDADPVAPRFDFPFVVPMLGIDMTIDIDLSFLDNAVEVFRIGELVSFILLLMSITPKMIRW